MSSTKIWGHLWHDLHKCQYLAQELTEKRLPKEQIHKKVMSNTTIDSSLIENNFEVWLHLLNQTCQWFNINDISVKIHLGNHNKVWPSKPIIVVRMDGCKKLHLRSTTRKLQIQEYWTCPQHQAYQKENKLHITIRYSTKENCLIHTSSGFGTMQPTSLSGCESACAPGIVELLTTAWSKTQQILIDHETVPPSFNS